MRLPVSLPTTARLMDDWLRPWLFGGVETLDAVADRKYECWSCGASADHLDDGLDDLLITGAATQIAADCQAGSLPCRPRTRSTITAPRRPTGAVGESHLRVAETAESAGFVTATGSPI